MNDKQIYQKIIELLDEAIITAKKMEEGTEILLSQAEALKLKKAA